MKRTTLLTSLAVVIIAVLASAVFYLGVREPAEVGTWKRKAVALDQYCDLKRKIHALQRTDLAEEPRTRAARFELLQMELPFWDLQEVWMCVGYEMKLENRDRCILDRDVDCVTRMWKEIEDAIARPKY